MRQQDFEFPVLKCRSEIQSLCWLAYDENCHIIFSLYKWGGGGNYQYSTVAAPGQGVKTEGLDMLSIVNSFTLLDVIGQVLLTLQRATNVLIDCGNGFNVNVMHVLRRLTNPVYTVF